MSSTLPAMKGRMGDMDYYLMSLKASELVNLVKEPKNMPGWDNEKIEEIYQRKINYGRVRNQIAPYLANNKTSRFFGSLIVAAFQLRRQGRVYPAKRDRGGQRFQAAPRRKGSRIQDRDADAAWRRNDGPARWSASPQGARVRHAGQGSIREGHPRHHR